MRLMAAGSPQAILVAAVIACQAATGVRAATGVTPTATEPSDCSTAVAAAAVLNPLALFDGWSSCAAEDRSEDANFLLILSQIRAITDVLTLVPLDEGLNDWAGGIEQAIQLLRYQFGDSEFYASYENAAPLDVRLTNAELLLPADYDPGWSYRMPVDAAAYGRTVQQQREARLRAMSFFAMRASAGRVEQPTIPIAVEDLVLPGMLAAQVAVGTPLTCSNSLASVSELNAWSLFIGANACSSERRVADALFLLLVGQSRADADMLVLRPLDDFEPGLSELFFEAAYQLGGIGFDPFFYVLAFYSFFGDQPFLEFLRGAGAVEALLRRVENASTALTPSYEPGWEYQPPADGAMYERAIASDRQNRAVAIRSIAYLLANDRYYRAQLEILDYLAAHVGEVLDGGDLMDIWAGIDAVLMAAFADPDFPQAQRQVASGFNGPVVRSTMVLFSEADVRQSWLSEALPEDELLALISGTDFDREALVTLALGRRSNASGQIILADVYYTPGVGVPQNDGYGISVMLGVVPRECGVPFTDSFPFVVARIAAMPGVAARVGMGESNFDGGCGPIVAGEPVTALVEDEFAPPTAEDIATVLAAVDEAAARRGLPGPVRRQASPSLR